MHSCSILALVTSSRSTKIIKNCVRFIDLNTYKKVDHTRPPKSNNIFSPANMDCQFKRCCLQLLRHVLLRLNYWLSPEMSSFFWQFSIIFIKPVLERIYKDLSERLGQNFLCRVAQEAGNLSFRIHPQHFPGDLVALLDSN